MRGAFGAKLAWATLILAALGPVGSALAAKDSEFEARRTVRHVEIHGNTAFSARKLRGLLRTHGSSFFRPWRHPPYRSDFLRFDRATLQTYYRRKGYLSAQVDSVRADPVPGSASRVDVHFYVTEGPLSRLTGVRLEGTPPLSEAEVRRFLKQKPNDPVDIARVESDRQLIEDRYANLGYVSIQVRDSLEISDGHATVVYRIEPGVVALLGQVGVEGNRTSRRKIVTRELALHPGDVLSREKLLKSQQRIYDTGLYSDVIFERGDIDSVTRLSDVLITVRERKMAWVDVGLGYGTADEVRLTSEWGHRNIGHEGIRFVASGRLGYRVLRRSEVKPGLGERRADANLVQPWIFGTRTQANLGGYAEQASNRDPDLDIPVRAYGAQVGFRRDLWQYTHGLLSIEQRHVIPDTTTALGRTYTTRRVGLTVERDSRTDLFDPKAGSDVIGNAEVAGGVLAGSSSFQKISGSASTYRPLPRRVTLAFRVRGGYVHPFGSRVASADTILNLIPIDDRFRTGGATSVRGYFENEIGFRITRTLEPDTAVSGPDTTFGTKVVEHGEKRGGAVLLLASVEARFPLVWILSGAIFLDAGNVWERPADITLKRLFTVAGPGAGYSDMRYTAGGGIRIGTPVGPVRFDYGWKLRHARPEEHDLSSSRGTFHFSLGQAF